MDFGFLKWILHLLVLPVVLVGLNMVAAILGTEQYLRSGRIDKFRIL